MTFCPSSSSSRRLFLWRYRLRKLLQVIQRLPSKKTSKRLLYFCCYAILPEGIYYRGNRVLECLQHQRLSKAPKMSRNSPRTYLLSAVWTSSANLTIALLVDLLFSAAAVSCPLLLIRVLEASVSQRLSPRLAITWWVYMMCDPILLSFFTSKIGSDAPRTNYLRFGLSCQPHTKKNVL